MKIAVLGCAHMHVHSYINALKKLGVEIVGLTDVNSKRGNEMAEELALKYYEDTDKLLNEECDAVLICSENLFHKKYTVQAANKGKHVIVEKPIATTYDDAVEMIDTCKNNNVKLMVCYPCRYATPVKEAKQLVDAGALGNVISITGTNHGSMPGGWFIDSVHAGGGAAIDHIVHVADIIHWFFKSPVKDVYSVMDTLIHPLKVEDCGHVLFELENGIIASIDHSWNRPSAFPCWGDVVIDINGTDRSIRIDAFIEHGNVYSNQNNKATQFSFGNDMDFEMMSAFVDCIENNLPAPITGEDGLFSLNLALLAYASNKKKDLILA